MKLQVFLFEDQLQSARLTTEMCSETRVLRTWRVVVPPPKSALTQTSVPPAFSASNTPEPASICKHYLLCRLVPLVFSLGREGRTWPHVGPGKLWALGRALKPRLPRSSCWAWAPTRTEHGAQAELAVLEGGGRGARWNPSCCIDSRPPPQHCAVPISQTSPLRQGARQAQARGPATRWPRGRRRSRDRDPSGAAVSAGAPPDPQPTSQAARPPAHLVPRRRQVRGSRSPGADSGKESLAARGALVTSSVCSAGPRAPRQPSH